MKHIWIALFFAFPILLQGQAENIFHDRAFWETKPSVSVIKQKIAEGNNAEALNSNAFDGVTYAINSGAPMESIEFLLSLEGNDVNKSTHDGRNYIMWAARSGNIDLVQLLLKKGSRTDVLDSHGYNVLTFTAVAGQTNPALYDLILANGLNVNSVNRSGANVLHLLAGSIKDENIIDYFVSKGLDIHSLDSDGNGMFNYAARGGNIPLMKTLINKGIDFKGFNDNGENALFFASKGGRGSTNSLEVFQYLENLGLDIDVVNHEGQTPLHYIVRNTKDLSLIEYFTQKGVGINQIDKEGNTAFLNAISANNIAVAKALISSVKDVNYANKEGYTALTHAVIGYSTELVDLLLSKGASLNLKDNKGNNLAYHLFNSYNKRNGKHFDKLFTLLKNKGVDFNDDFEGGNTLIHIAIEKGDEDLLRKSLTEGIDVNKKNEEGLTPLHLAAMKAKNDKLLNILLQNKADKSILTDFEESAFDLAKENELLTNTNINLEFLKKP